MHVLLLFFHTVIGRNCFADCTAVITTAVRLSQSLRYVFHLFSFLLLLLLLCTVNCLFKNGRSEERQQNRVHRGATRSVRTFFFFRIKSQVSLRLTGNNVETAATSVHSLSLAYLFLLVFVRGAIGFVNMTALPLDSAGLDLSLTVCRRDG